MGKKYQQYEPSRKEQILADFFNTMAYSEMVVLRRIELGAWNMDADATKVFLLGTDRGFKDLGNNGYKRILESCVKIIDDNGVEYTGNQGIESVVADGTNLTITRITGGIFDNTNFNDTSVNRGELCLRITL